MPGNILSLHMHISENVLTHICQHPPQCQMYYTDFRWYFSKLMFIMHQLFSIVNYISIHLELHVIAF